MNTMNTPKPPWGDGDGNPWKEFRDFEVWYNERLKSLDDYDAQPGDVMFSAALYGMCCDAFQAGLNRPEPTEPITDYLQDLG